MQEEEERLVAPSPWLQLLRVPNLLTVPGDPLAGFLLALRGSEVSLARAGLAAAAALCLYAAGLVFNDLQDLETDRSERPARPLPSGAMPLPQARLAARILLGAGPVLALLAGWRAFAVSGLLVLAITAYNSKLKSHAWYGPLSMGACRALSLLLGAAAHPLARGLHPRVLIAALTLAAYVASVTAIARRETRPVATGPRRFLPAAVLALGLLALPRLLLRLMLFDRVCFLVAYAGALGIAMLEAIRLGEPMNEPVEVPLSIAALLRGLLPLQAAFILAAGTGSNGALLALGLIALWPVCWMLSRRWQMS